MDVAFREFVPNKLSPWGRMRQRENEYRYVATSVAGFIQQVAVSYVANGYFHYVMGVVPDGKDPEATDRRILEKYRIAVSKHTRYRRAQAGHSNFQYLRHDRVFVILARRPERGAGEDHPFWSEEAANIRDLRRVPLKFAGYSVSFRAGKVSVRIKEKSFRDLKAEFVGDAASRTGEELFERFRSLPFEPYAPIRVGLHEILRAVNRRRAGASLQPVPKSAIRARRRIVKPFDSELGPQNEESETL